jgi:ribosomal protein L24E
MAKKAGFVFVHWDGSKWHFCSWDCVMRYAATKEPLMVVES